MQEQILKNAENILANHELLQHLSDAIKLMAPFVIVIVSLLTWAWRRMEKSQDKLEELLTKHIESDDEIHDKLFDYVREADEKLNNLIGEHHATHGGK
jgi:hypothetical protein